MTINYTTLLGLAQPVTGTEAGTWGDTVNDEITALVEEAIAGGESISVTAGNVTLTDTAGQANQARNAILIITGTPGTTRNVVAPSQSKAYIVVNNSDSSIVIKGAATTGVTIAAGSRSLVAWNGSDFVEIGQAGDVDGPTTSTDNAIARFDGTTGKIIQNSAVTIADTTGDISTPGYVITGAGAVGTPAYTTTGDLNTGIFFPAADTIAFAEGGVEAMRIDSSGNVGVGTSTPTSFLSNWNGLAVGTTSGSNGIAIVSGTASPGTLAFADGSSGSDQYRGYIQYGHSSDALLFGTATSERMRIDSSGNVGIGNTPSGTYKLEVTGSGYYSTSLTLGTNLTFTGTGNRITGDFSNATASNRVLFQTSTTNAATAIGVLPNGTGTVGNILGYNNSDPTNASTAIIGATSVDARIQSGITGTGTYLPMTFYTGGSERMRIDTSGNVGIGTTSPFTPLDVNGYSSFGVRNTTPLNLNTATHYFGSSPADSTRNNVVISLSDTSTTPPRLRFFKSRGSSASPTVVSSGDAAGIIQFYAYDGAAYQTAAAIQSNIDTTPGANDMPGNLIFSTTADGAVSATERMRIHSGGGVSIGNTTDPGAAALSVTGGINSTRIRPRAVTDTSSATPTINTDNTDIFGLTAQAVDITSFTTNLSGTPTDGQKLQIYIVGTAARAITWGASFESSTVTLPTTTVGTNRLDVGFVWNAATSKWRCLASA